MKGDTRILVIDDDRNICELLQLYLEREGYRVLLAHDGSEGLDAFRRENPDLVILDIMLPLISGWDVCRLIRRHSGVPIIMLTARDASEEKVSGLDMGADDYVVKPFDPREVAARVRARLRKREGGTEAAGKSLLAAPGLILDMKKYEVRCGERLVNLSPREIQLLHYFLVNKNVVLSREQILDKVWGYGYAGETRTVDMHVKKLREKLKGGTGWEIKTVFGVGYKFEVKDHV
ncbi:MAG: response regulator transcription factor [Peptococcaceae bacterium]|nr:response regulator transcription factor [Peptococcaceae bacterium]